MTEDYVCNSEFILNIPKIQEDVHKAIGYENYDGFDKTILYEFYKTSSWAHPESDASARRPSIFEWPLAGVYDYVEASTLSVQRADSGYRLAISVDTNGIFEKFVPNGSGVKTPV